MKKRFLSALLAMAMVLTMLPMSAFAADEAVVAPEVEAYGFVWEDLEPNADLGSGYKAGPDWMGETMWVALKDGATAGQNLWFEVTVGADTWGCAAKTSAKQMLAFSFLNRTTQWEQTPEGITVGAGQEHATKYMADKNVTEATLKVYVTEKEFTSTEHNVTGLTPIFNEKVAIKESESTLVKVPVKEDPIFVAASNDEFAKKTVADVQTGNITFELVEGDSANASTVAVSGVTLTKIEGWKEFNQALEEEQSGYYLAFAVKKTVNDKVIKGMILQGKDAEGKPVAKKYETEDELNAAFTDATNTQCNLFIHVGADAAAVKDKAPVIKLKYGDEQNYTEYTLDLSQVKVEGEAPAPTADVIAAPLDDQDTPELDNNLIEEYKAAVGTSKTEGNVTTVEVKLSGKNLKAHKNGLNKVGNWVGIGVPKANGNKYAQAWTVGELKDYKDAGDAEYVVGEKTYVTIYFDVTDHLGKTGVVSVKNGDKTTNYVITFDIALAEVPETKPVIENVAFEDGDTPLLKVSVNGLDAAKQYQLVVKKDGAAFETVDVAGDLVSVELAKDKLEGKYSVALTEKDQTTALATSELEICKVTYDLNGGTAIEAPAAQYVVKGEAIALHDGTGLTKKDYTFAGWGVALNDEDKYVVTEINTKLTAQWKNDNVTHVDAEVTTGTLEPTVADEVKKTTVDSSAMLTDPAVLAETDKLAEQIPQDTTDILTDEQKTESGFVLKVAVYMEVAAKEYTPASDTNPNPVLKLEITPKSKLVAVKSVQGQPDKIEDVAEGKANAKPLPVTEFVNPVTINVVLPAGFATAGDNDIFAKHMGTTVQYIETTVTNGVDTLAGSVIATFEANEFSPYELTKDARKVAVTFKDAEGNVITEIGAAGVLNLSPVNIGEDLPTVTAPDGYEFKGWAVAADKTKVVYNGKLTEEYLTEMSKTATLELFAVVTKSSGGSTGPAPGGIGGGSSGTTTYSVNVPTVSNGTVTVNPRNAAKDATVTITVAPNQGYHLESLTVTDKDGNKIELTKVDATKYTFKMPASRVEVKAVFAEGEAPAVSFTDVAEGEYYYDAVKWAVDKGVTNGLTETTFGPNASCTRAQMVTFLWRAAGSPEPTATTTAFTDIDANEYYYKAVLWAVEKGITTGTTETTFSPNATVTRAQTVTFLYRYAGSPAVSGSNNFTDLEAGEYYINAVQWAATNGITTGTTETTFSPANNCTRGQIVTFLYRHIVK